MRSAVSACARVLYVTVLVTATAGPGVAAQSVFQSKHNVSATAAPDACVYCHAPTRAGAIVVPRWDPTRRTPTSFVAPPTGPLDASCVPAPSAVSLVCLGCHDGALSTADGPGVLAVPAFGQLSAWPVPPACQERPGPAGGMEAEEGWLASTRRTHHPVSAVYEPDRVPADLKRPPDALAGWGADSPEDVKLYSGRVECGSCHDPHNSAHRPFLRKSNAHDALCLTCHIK